MKILFLLTSVLGIVVALICYAGNLTPSETWRLHMNPNPLGRITADQARKLTSQQRLALLKKALLIGKLEQQYANIDSIVHALTKDELPEATSMLSASHISDHYGIMLRLSVRWGCLDPIGGMRIMNDPYALLNGLRRNALMSGWFETDPASALAWSELQSANPETADMAAHVLGLSIGPYHKKLLATIENLRPNDVRIPYCLERYFGLYGVYTGNYDPAALYEKIPTHLRHFAWPITMERLTYIDQQHAVAWLNAHVNDQGRDYKSTNRLLDALAKKDPAGTAQWASTLPESTDDEKWKHPAFVATLRWYEEDPAAAKVWLHTQPTTLPWVGMALKRIEAKEKPREPEAEKTEP